MPGITRAQAWAVVHQIVRAEGDMAMVLTDGSLIDHQRIAWQTVTALVELYATDPQFAGFVDGMVLDRRREQAAAAERAARVSVWDRRSLTRQIGREL